MIKVISTGNSSAYYGKCEGCGEFCSEVFHAFGTDNGGRYRDLYGCKECAESVAQNGNNPLPVACEHENMLPSEPHGYLYCPNCGLRE